MLKSLWPNWDKKRCYRKVGKPLGLVQAPKRASAKKAAARKSRGAQSTSKGSQNNNH